MRAYGKSWDYNVYDCRYCLYWKSRKRGCVYPDGCCPVDQRDAVQFRDDEDKENTAPVSECRNCPYGRAPEVAQKAMASCKPSSPALVMLRIIPDHISGKKHE